MEEKPKIQEDNFNVGPFSLLTKSVKANNEVLIALRNNKKLLGKVKALLVTEQSFMRKVDMEMWWRLIETAPDKYPRGLALRKKKTEYCSRGVVSVARRLGQQINDAGGPCGECSC